MDNTFDKLMKLREIPDAYEQWAGYRKSLTEYIIRNTETDTVAMIVGAGRCNDLDLSELSFHFDEIVLVDIDHNAMRQGMEFQKRMGDSLMDNVRLVKADIIGITGNFYRRLCCDVEAVIKETKDPEMVEVIMESYMKRAYAGLQVGEELENVCRDIMPDYIICSGVHSQVNNIFPQLAEVYSNYIDIDLNRTFAETSLMNEKIAAQLNEALLSCASRAVILGLEVSKLGQEGAIEGALQGIEDIEAREQTIVDTEVVAWPLSLADGKIYNMKLMTIQCD